MLNSNKLNFEALPFNQIKLRLLLSKSFRNLKFFGFTKSI